MHTHPPTVALAALSSLVLATAPFSIAAADDAATTTEDASAPATRFVPSSPASPLTFTFSPTISHQFETDIDTPADASMTLSRAGGSLSAATHLNKRTRLSITLDNEWSFYDFAGDPFVPSTADDPISDALQLGLSATLFHSIDSTWSVLGQGSVTLAQETGADTSDSLLYSGFIAASRRMSDTLSLSLGVFVSTQLEDDARVLPIVGIQWQISDTLRLASEGPGLRLSSQINDQWTVSLAGRYESREFRLDDSGQVPDGVFRDRSVPIELAFDYAASDAVSVRLFAGVTVWNELTVDNANGDELFEDTTDPTGFVGIQGTLRY